jgi:Cytochrome P460
MSHILSRSLLILVMLCGFAASAFADESADESPAPSWYKENPHTGYEMNGIHLSDYADFYEKWKLVTVTYRSDLHELRMVYANPLAYETLMKGGTDYPDGAVFAKIPMAMADDPAFPNSGVAYAAERYQFMVRNKKKYPESYGWGYAMFDPWGKVHHLDEAKPMSNSEATAFCVACHTNVKDRNYIFSRLPEFNPAHIQAWIKNQEVDVTRTRYSEYPKNKLPPDVQKLIPSEYETVRLLESDVKNSEYNGTMYETRPLLIKEAVRSGQPALLLSKSGKRLCLVEPVRPAQEPTAPACDNQSQLYASYWTLGLNPDDGVSKDLFCRSKKP